MLTKKKKIIFSLLAIGIGLAFPLLCIEIILHFLPVSEGIGATDVNAETPVFHFEPGAVKQYSKDWNFSLNNRVRTNNYGFVNDQDYSAQLQTPLLAVIGDSYVEASMVPYSKTIHGRLQQMAGDGRVYSFAASGAPLSQYLIWAQYARDEFKPDAYLFMIVANDFDESLAEYKQSPGFHYYFKENEKYQLKRVDLVRTKSLKKRVLVTFFRNCRLARYFSYNLQAVPRLKMVFTKRQEYVGNVSAQVTEKRLFDSKTAVDLFFDDLPKYTGVDSSKILFVIDGVRPAIYDDEALKASQDSFWAKMREFFIDRAQEFGSPVIDMQPIFIQDFKVKQKRFEFVNDGHWNELAHQMAADAASKEELFQSLFLGQ